MKQKVLYILSAIFRAIDRLLCWLYIKRPTVVVYMDGGLSSQMFMYIHGRYYAEQGFEVLYDTHWFDICGRDANGKMLRNFELLEMWPALSFKSATYLQRKYYLLFFIADISQGMDIPKAEQLKHSIYFYGYWGMSYADYARLYATYFDIATASAPMKYAGKDFDKGVAGIHVRRGDLAKGDNPAYGGVSDGYFLRAIDFCNKQYKPTKYLFFSDEPDWVEKNICTQLKQPYEIMRGNKAWEDLWLLSHCDVIIASQGSFGKVAAQMNPKAVLIQCDNKYAVRDRINSYFVK